MMHIFRFLAVAFVGFSVIGLSPSVAQLTLIPTDDGYVAENDPKDIKNDAAMNARSETDNDRNDIIYLRFDVSEFADPITQAHRIGRGTTHDSF